MTTTTNAGPIMPDTGNRDAHDETVRNRGEEMSEEDLALWEAFDRAWSAYLQSPERAADESDDDDES